MDLPFAKERLITFFGKTFTTIIDSRLVCVTGGQIWVVKCVDLGSLTDVANQMRFNNTLALPDRGWGICIPYVNCLDNSLTIIATDNSTENCGPFNLETYREMLFTVVGWKSPRKDFRGKMPVARR